LIAQMGREADDLHQELAECPKARSVSIHDRCKAVYEGLDFTVDYLSCAR
jgi:hypothetical protein